MMSRMPATIPADLWLALFVQDRAIPELLEAVKGKRVALKDAVTICQHSQARQQRILAKMANPEPEIEE